MICWEKVGNHAQNLIICSLGLLCRALDLLICSLALLNPSHYLLILFPCFTKPIF